MPRIRNVKPEFFRHEDLQSLESKYPKNRVMLTFSGLWTQCDKQGVFPYKPNQLHLDVLPFVKFDMEGTLNILVESGYIKRFISDGNEYGFIPTFRKHQAISGKEKDCKFQYPEPPKDDQEQPGDDPEPSSNTPEQAESAPEQTNDVLEQGGIVPGKFQSSSIPVPDRPDFMTSLHHDFMTSEHTQERAREEVPQPPALKPVSGEIFASLQAGFLSHNGGRFTNPSAEAQGIRAIIGYAAGNIEDLEIMIGAFYKLTVSQDKFWSRQPFLPSVLAKPGIWDRVKVEAKKSLSSGIDDDFARFEEEDRANGRKAEAVS